MTPQPITMPFEEALLIEYMSDVTCREAIRSIRTGGGREDGFRFLFFKIGAEMHACMADGLTLAVTVEDQGTTLVANGYRGSSSACELGPGTQHVSIPKELLEVGENVLAVKGRCTVETLSYLPLPRSPEAPNRHASCPGLDNGPVGSAAAFLCDSVIRMPDTSPFKGSCYCFYDYDNQCYRKPCWLWSDAPAVAALFQAAELAPESSRADRYRETALAIARTLLRHQVTDRSDPNFGALVSRYRYYAHSPKSFDCLLGPNDTSFIVKWALMPSYRATGDETFLQRSKWALDWLIEVINGHDYVPSQYYADAGRWEDGAFIDSGFTSEGLREFAEIVPSHKQDCVESIHTFMQRFVAQFKMENGYYNMNYSPTRGTYAKLFARGHGWALEGLLAAYEATREMSYLDEAVAIAERLRDNQTPEGAWPFLLGEGAPDDETKRDTGICEKGTALLGYLFHRLADASGSAEFIPAADRALDWCEHNMVLQAGPGHGGIASRSMGSGIVGNHFLRVATGYANAFYILGALCRAERSATVKDRS